MGIDIYARWKGQNDEDRARQESAWSSLDGGNVGYLREAYHGGPYATIYLCLEAFQTGEAKIAASLLQERLPRTLALVEERHRTLYKASDEEVRKAKQAYCDFVALCRDKEKETGEPVSIAASY